jgi:hypothetical protein
MIKNIIAMLQINEFYCESENIDIAKGKYKLHKSFKKLVQQSKREIKNKANGRG